MINYLETTGRTEDDAIAAALRELGMERDDVSVEILERAKSGFLGIGASPARIRVTWETPDEPVKEPAKAEAAPAPAEKTPAAALSRCGRPFYLGLAFLLPCRGSGESVTDYCAAFQVLNWFWNSASTFW